GNLAEVGIRSRGFPTSPRRGGLANPLPISMAESQRQGNEPSERDSAAPGVPSSPASVPPVPSPPPAPRPAADIGISARLAASDEAPTIISKKPPGALQPDGTFAEILRGRRLAHFELLEPI